MSSQSDTALCLPNDNTKEHVDHRKRRRNRTTLSCLNCHGSKRMVSEHQHYDKRGIAHESLIARKRPACSRCTKLGLSGTCVYEVDDLNRRDASYDEILILKNRIAELEGFIREYKKKPHPRTVVRRKNSPTSSDNGNDIDPSNDRLDESGSTVGMMQNDSSSESDNDPRTPTSQEDDPIFLRSATSSISASSPMSNHSIDLGRGIGPAKSDPAKAMDIDTPLDFGNGNIFCEDNENLERVFARIMGQEARELYITRDCGCVKDSSACSAILDLAPHLRRALDALRSVPEHQAQISEFGSPCHYLSQFQSLTDAISPIVESPAASIAPSSAASVPQVQPIQTGVIPSANACMEDSPLRRVLARRAGLVPSPVSAPQTPVAPSPKRAWRSNTIQTTWEASQPVIGPDSLSVGKDPFMSWDPPPRGTWPRTISL